jgi:tellurite resistance protein TehA-like permease
VLGKVARHNFPITGVVPNVAHAGEIFYLVGLLVGITLWGFALVWFIVAIIMIATAFPFPFNMGWWGFVFPVGESKSAVIIQVLLCTHRDNRSFHAFDNLDW